jgi:flagellar motor protein MotB
MADHDKEHDEQHEKHAKGAHGHGGAHGGGHEEGHEGAPEWLISFADNVALLMGFFVIMLAMNMKTPGGGSGSSPQTNEGNGPSPAMLDTIIGLRAAFNNPINPNSNDPAELPFVARLATRGKDTEPQEPGPPGKDHDVQSLRQSNYHGPCGIISFDDGSSRLSAEGLATARDVARRVRGLRFVISVRGHASAAEASKSPDRGMQLSYDRALAAARALDAAGVKWDQMRIVACADNDRLNPVTYNDAGHKPNQRVEIVATDTVLPEYVSTDSQPATTMEKP